MSDLLTTSTEKFAAFKKDIERNKLVCGEIALTDITIASDEYIEVAGATLPIDKAAFMDLIKILGLNKKILKNFQEFMSEEAKFALLRAMQNGLANAGNTNVYMYATPDKVVVRILKNKKPGLSEQAYLNMVERALNDNPELSINSYAVDHRGLHLNLLNESQEINIKGMSDESFHFGLSIDNDFNKGTIVSPFNERLVCTNGMVTRVDAGSFALKNMTSENWDSFFNHMNELKSNHYIAPGFLQNVKKAAETPASVLELENARRRMQGLSNVGNDVDLWLGYENMKSKYSAAGVDLETASNEKKATAQSDKSVWDVVNAMTDFASHTYSYEISDFRRNQLKAYAGEVLFKGEFDMNNIMTVNPFA